MNHDFAYRAGKRDLFEPPRWRTIALSVAMMFGLNYLLLLIATMGE